MGKTTQHVKLVRAPQGAQIRRVSLAELSETMRQQDLEQAFARGQAEGQRQAQEAAAGALALAVERLDQAREQALDQLTIQAVELSVEIARQLIQVEIAAENYDLERIIRSSLSHAGMGRGAAVVHVSPEDFERLAHVAFREGTEVAADSKLRSGDVQVESPQGLLVREVDACLETIREQLLEDVA
ncbi:MAG: hypothetical protein H6830_09605 [Planctomycetes bacterium]|nr:hypothetical protein [Planctomycetota bacterium]MCB9909980.1 hypothetical protein [Planctomycetota bacterium]HPF12714.1 FliH/SctL family protein [Planctomycetota bacterium]HRV80615.1 FliH/SctL family protein [Planctomycetota bacterium]